MINLILKAHSKAIRSGIKPSEVWLGAEEASILEDYMDWHNSENAIIMGLTIHHMKSNGVRVGDSVAVTVGDFEKTKLEKAVDALRLIAAPVRPDGTFNRCREACQQLAEQTLKELDKSEK